MLMLPRLHIVSSEAQETTLGNVVPLNGGGEQAALRGKGLDLEAVAFRVESISMLAYALDLAASIEPVRGLT